ncbi:hypothetical protein Bresa_02146|uniref:Uncharacterized protein n=1 Tax=Brenneria salicis ATCC 15712 = DSM 30166 TaxID=714314 RepID=A0A366I4C6_9GAMM|nr:hypothetical protein [Brenneria salicis]NMN91916.1 hypothetical protein [Brenneria salicis ATCC 15712 = DSM 30166]RBP62864.1 hypothetical protein DES54_11443 [Brenneria salicis ATCC 15712 = DSM 30166]
MTYQWEEGNALLSGNRVRKNQSLALPAWGVSIVEGRVVRP